MLTYEVEEYLVLVSSWTELKLISVMELPLTILNSKTDKQNNEGSYIQL